MLSFRKILVCLAALLAMSDGAFAQFPRSNPPLEIGPTLAETQEAADPPAKKPAESPRQKKGKNKQPRGEQVQPQRQRPELQVFAPDQEPVLINEEQGTAVICRKALSGKKGRKASDAVTPHKAIAVIRADEEMTAADFDLLAEEILANKELFEELVICINSGGGTINDYALKYHTVGRLRKAGVSIVVCIDEAACSGGYLMAIPANKIIAAELADVGSLAPAAVIQTTQQKKGQKTRIITPAKLKFPIDENQEPSELHIARIQKEIDFLSSWLWAQLEKHRPQVAAHKAEICDGASWQACESMKLEVGLVDEIGTSTEYLWNHRQTKDIWEFGLVAGEGMEMMEVDLGEFLGGMGQSAP